MRKRQRGINKMPWRMFLLMMAVVVLGLGFRTEAKAAGLLIADGGFGGVLEIREHTVDVTVNSGIAVTKVTQVFKNTENRQVEALYTFPVPKGASVSNFSMWINGKEMVGEVLEKKRARQIYESYKRTRRDPGLLEQKDFKTFEMRIFPINAGASQKVEITYYQELGVDNDQATYVYPLATVTSRGLDSQARGKFAINFNINSAIPIKDVRSPSHSDGFVINNHSDNHTQASLETNGGSLNKDIVLNIDMSRPQTGIDVLTSAQKGADGFFLMTVTAGEELKRDAAGMDYVFVLDISGSMGNDGKLALSQKAVEGFVGELAENDRFEAITFNIVPEALFGGLEAASRQNISRVTQYLGSKSARGGTDLVSALSAALKYASDDRPLKIVVLSDGMTERGSRDTLLSLARSKPANVSVICIGIGNETDRLLLERVAHEAGGFAAFVSHGDDFKRQARAFKRKLTRPAVTNLKVDFGGLDVYGVVPKDLPNLYHGQPLLIYGRYKKSWMQGKTAKVTISGQLLGRDFKKTGQLEFPSSNPDNPEIERMWALKQIRELTKGPKDRIDKAEVIRLAEEFSIVTQYTSFIVLENDAEYRRWKIKRRNLVRFQVDREAQAKRQESLKEIRNRAASGIGPEGARKAPKQVAAKKSSQRKNPQSQSPGASPSPQPDRRSERSNSGFSFGSGPVGPVFAAYAWWLRRRKKSKGNTFAD